MFFYYLSSSGKPGILKPNDLVFCRGSKVGGLSFIFSIGSCLFSEYRGGLNDTQLLLPPPKKEGGDKIREKPLFFCKKERAEAKKKKPQISKIKKNPHP